MAVLELYTRLVINWSNLCDLGLSRLLYIVIIQHPHTSTDSIGFYSSNYPRKLALVRKHLAEKL